MNFLFQREPWMKEAKCRGMDTTLWFPMRGESQKAAKAVCAECSVAEECWEYACRTETSYGIWGGKIIKRGKDKNTDLPPPSYGWDKIFLTEYYDEYWDGWQDEVGESFG